ncbi:MAG: glycosyltransferase family 4 protein [Candidatus Peribacteraceae bacterium]|nr:glycosyltransferase family 4 protein [Candidatus Peribacteraceae bacterium]MDD5739321.1 glycosyltransferase family 4 protein [Candidatus Peribacteraceae bacterium]
MKIILATGIYPPEIGGPATYVKALASTLSAVGHHVAVVTYEAVRSTQYAAHEDADQQSWKVITVSRRGGPLLRWWRYAKVLRQIAADADVVEAFSSVSAGVPLMLARLKKPKKVLRLGGDFFWERYTDRGGTKGLKEWYASVPRSKYIMQKILASFDHIVFSTEYQKALYRAQYRLPMHSVIENALPSGTPVLHTAHMPFHLLFMGRFVAFKNLPVLVRALTFLPQCSLTFVGDGPMSGALRALTQELHLSDRILFLPSQNTATKTRTMADADLLVLPSITELSPNVALEARAQGLPVLLTRATGFGEALTRGMVLRDLKTPEQIAQAIADVRSRYGEVAQTAALPPAVRGWDSVTREHLQLFQSV